MSQSLSIADSIEAYRRKFTFSTDFFFTVYGWEVGEAGEGLEVGGGEERMASGWESGE